MATMTVLDSVGGTQTVEKPLAPGQVARAASRPVTLATEDITALTATQTVSGTVAVSSLPATPAGTNNIGDVDVLTVISGTGATNLGKAIDTAVGSTDTGTGTLVKRVDTLATLTPANGDWVPAQVDAQGALWVRIVADQVEAGEYEDVAASTASTFLGSTGAQGDFLSSITVFPENLNPGAITLQDGNITAVTIFAGGTGSVSNLIPFTINFGHACVSATTPGWKVVTGASVHIRAVGNFT